MKPQNHRLSTKHFILAPLLLVGVLPGHLSCTVENTHASRKTSSDTTRMDAAEAHAALQQKLCDFLNAGEAIKAAKKAAASASVESGKVKAILKEFESFEIKQDFSQQNGYDKAREVTDIATKITEHFTLEPLKNITLPNDPNKQNASIEYTTATLKAYCTAKDVYNTHRDAFGKTNGRRPHSLIKAAISLTQATISLIEATVEYYGAIEVAANAAAADAWAAVTTLNERTKQNAP